NLAELRPDFAQEMVVEIVDADRDAVRALRAAAVRLDDRFLLLDGSRYVGSNWLDLVPALQASDALACVRRIGTSDGEADAGVTLADLKILEHLPDGGPLEAALGAMRARGLATQRIHDGSFESGAAAWGARARPAVFFDRDGTINVNTHY